MIKNIYSKLKNKKKIKKKIILLNHNKIDL